MTKHQFLKGYIAYDPYTLLLLHMDGANGGVSFPDSSRFNRTIVVGGNVNTSTARQKFGSASALFDGSGDYLSNADSDMALGSADFTVDFWIYPTSSAANMILVDTQVFGGSSTRTNSIIIALETTRKIYIYHNGYIVLTTSNTLTLNTWGHVAVVRSGSTVTVYVNGVSGGSVSLSKNLSTQNFVVGINASNLSAQPYIGNVDEMRVSIGIARWTSNFTPPTLAYFG
jgi:hypothetical protein